MDDYYSSQAVAGKLGHIGIPTLIVAARRDPMVPASMIEQGLIGASAAVDVRWLDRGGHVGFPPRTRLGSAGPFGLEPQVLVWFGRDPR